MSGGSSSKSVSIIPFDGKDFGLWKLKVKATLKGQGWYHVLDPDAKIKREHKDDDKPKVYAFLVNCLSNSVLSLFAAYADVEDDPLVLWNALIKHYERDTMASKHATRAMMLSMHLLDGEDVSVYVSRILSCAQKLRSMNDSVSDSDLLYSLLNGLPEEYDTYKAMIRIKDGVDFADAVKYLKDQYDYRCCVRYKVQWLSNIHTPHMVLETKLVVAAVVVVVLPMVTRKDLVTMQMETVTITTKVQVQVKVGLVVNMILMHIVHCTKHMVMTLVIVSFRMQHVMHVVGRVISSVCASKGKAVRRVKASL